MVYVLAHNVHSYVTDTYEVWHLQNLMEPVVVDRALAQIQPDLVIVFYHTALIQKLANLQYAPANCPVYFWTPYEGSYLPDDTRNAFIGVPEDRFIHLSDFAQNLWADSVKSKYVIPHTYDPEVFKYVGPNSTRKESLREKFSRRFRHHIEPNATVVLNLDRNIWHKRWDACFDYVRQLQTKTDSYVQLIAHTMTQASHSDTGHPPMFDLKKLETFYGIEGRVIYTDFNWGKGLTPLELAELYELCDIRVSMSMGEGFGVLNLEASAVGCPQVVNGCTNLPEIYGDSDYLIEPAFQEEKLGSLWQVPNVRKMVERSVDLLNRDCEVESQRLWERVESKFSMRKAGYLWEKLLAESTLTPRIECWYKHRFGYNQSVYAQKYMSNLPKVCFALVGTYPKVFEIQSFDGRFVVACAESGFVINAIESDAEAIKRMPTIAKRYVSNRSSSDGWPEADVVVLTDAFESILEFEGIGAVNTVLEKLATYKWVLMRRGFSHRWGTVPIEPESVGLRLIELGMTRRTDLEDLVRQNILADFSHEIWSKDADTSVIPIKLIGKR